MAVGYNGFHTRLSKVTGEIFDCDYNVQLSTAIRYFGFQQQSPFSPSNYDFNFQPRFSFSTLNCDCNFQPRFQLSTTIRLFNAQLRFQLSTAIQVFNAQLRLQLPTAIPIFNRDSNLGLHFQRPTVAVTAVDWLLKILFIGY